MTDEVLQGFRDELDEIDPELIALLSRRFAITAQVGAHKKTNNLPLRDPQREAAQLERIRAYAKQKGMDPEIAARIFRVILDETVQTYENL